LPTPLCSHQAPTAQEKKGKVKVKVKVKVKAKVKVGKGKSALYVVQAIWLELGHHK